MIVSGMLCAQAAVPETFRSAESPEIEVLRREGYGFFKTGFYHLGIVKFNRAQKDAGPHDQALCLLDKGLGYQLWGKYKEAEQHYQNALKSAQNLDDPQMACRILIQTGLSKMDTGRFDMSIADFDSAAALADKNRLAAEQSIALYNKGLVFQAWGALDKAEKLYQQALELSRKKEIIESHSSSLNALGDVYLLKNDLDSAEKWYNQALDFHTRNSVEHLNIITYFRLGRLNTRLKQYDSAVKYYQNSLRLSQQHLNHEYSIKGIHGIGRLSYAQGDLKAARRFFKMGLLLARQQGYTPLAAELENDIGICDYEEGRLDSAINQFKAAIEKKEAIRITVEGSLKREYLSSQIDSYHWLTSAYLKAGHCDVALNTIEQATAKYLVEQMGKKSGLHPEFKNAASFSKNLDPDTIVISYVMSGGSLLTADRDTVQGTFFDLPDSCTKVIENFEPYLTMALKKHRNIINLQENDTDINVGKSGWNDVYRLIRYYRILLSDQTPSRRHKKHMKAIGKTLYTLLLKPVSSLIQSKKNIVIMPDGILNFIPFETLILPDGRYLVEKYNIQYVQSLTVSAMIQSRQYPEDRKDLMAFGGAVYNEASYSTDMEISKTLLAGIRNNLAMLLSQNRGIKSVFTALGMDNFSNLPGTLAEVSAIRTILPESTIFTGKDVNELKIKILNENGMLKKYKNLHFATHGQIVPGIPELSSLVLSSQSGADSNVDGYLTMTEIAGLDLKADFVNLSACNTGLGKLYSGEGVVGLSQAFLVAGANSLSVSLWPVADESTMHFMTGLYNLVYHKKMTYSHAINQVKRNFIKGDDFETRFNLPFFWAPFVYYGKIN